MKITVISVGDIKEKYLNDAINEYAKRLSKYCKLTFIKVADEPNTDNPSDKEIEMVKNKEGIKILKALPQNSFKIALNLKGQMLSSEELAKKILDTCIACGVCASECPVDAIKEGDIYVIDPEQCIDCGAIKYIGFG